MALYSTLRSRRLANNHQQLTQKIIAFRLNQEWFALPILAVQKVVLLGKVYGDPQHTGISFTRYEENELLVIDIGQHIFNNLTSNSITIEDSEVEDFLLSDLASQRYLIIVRNQEADLVGLPIDSQPIMYNVGSDAFKPLPPDYLKQGNIKCISSEIISIPDIPPIFFLQAHKLTEYKQILGFVDG